MAGLTSTGIGSGLDVAGLVSKLVDAERTPVLTRLATKEATLQAQLSGFGLVSGALDKVKSALDALNSPTLLTANKTTVGDDSRFTASADASAAPGSYSVQVSQLATGQKLASGAFSGPDAVVGSGTLTLALGGNSVDISIDDGNDTLAGIRDAINAARDAAGQPLGVTATLVTSTGGTEPAGTYLLLTSSVTGAANTISLAASGGDGGLAALQYQTGGANNGLTERQAPANAVVQVDGFTYASASNTVTGALAGVTLNLKATTAAPVTLTVGADTGAVRGKLQALVDAYNGLHQVIKQQAGYDAAAGKGGVLIGEPALRNLESQLRRALTEPLGGAGPIESAADLGLGFDASGTMTLDGAKLDALLAGDRGAVAGFLQGEQGVIGRLEGVVDGYLGSAGGILKARTDGIDRRLKDIADQRDALAARMDALQQQYLKQFNALDSLLGQLQSTGTFLTQQLASLPGAQSADK
ncbi:flagellar filament capping protein FliD [Immundisolibacter sp.]|uniref:flagellar filament capping protein FliD n=1 Tax=Immundisolibacter sp. TaxID=1934948 RepID=UPI0026099FD2|nr:flagellar filament capping protein FliD [Immundisolibacter sp.]MDD3650266.1 flagellar filament capping protein FliD [Immundisolibacter sp.]